MYILVINICIDYYKHITIIFIYQLQLKGSFDAIVKLLPSDLVVIGLSCGNSLFQCKIRLRTIDTSSRLRIGRSFVY